MNTLILRVGLHGEKPSHLVMPMRMEMATEHIAQALLLARNSVLLRRPKSLLSRYYDQMDLAACQMSSRASNGQLQATSKVLPTPRMERGRALKVLSLT